MDLTTVKSIYRNTAAYANKEVTLGGWIRTMRVSKNFGFIELNDGSFFKNIQIVFEAERLKNYEEISKQNVGADYKRSSGGNPRSKAALRGKGNTD